MTEHAVVEAIERLRTIVRELDSAVIAFSGGVDSTLLARIVHEELGNRCLAVTATSDLHPPDEVEHARQLALLIGIRHKVIETAGLDLPGLADNPLDRCYLCKKALLTKLRAIADEMGFRHVAEGANADDEHGYRPGMKAVAELGVRSPLKDAGITKAMIRTISRKLELPTWNQPPSPCLATRFPYGERMTVEVLKRVAHAEAYLHSIGLGQFRVRVHGELARIETEPADLSRLVEEKIRLQVVRTLKELGFRYVAIDMEGYRSGAMDEALRTR